MQGPPTSTEDDNASIPTETVRDDPNMNRTFTVRRKAAKRTFPYDLKIGETIQLALPRPQDEEIPARKRPCLEESFPTSTDEAATENTLHDTTAELPPPPSDATATAADAGADYLADLDPVMDYCIDPAAARTGKWTSEEDKRLTSAVTSTREKKRGKKYSPDWVAISTQVPGRTRAQCRNRWHDTLESKIDPTTACKGKWTAGEDNKLTSAVTNTCTKKCGKEYTPDWVAISAQVPGRTIIQCRNRWRHVRVNGQHTKT
jgi:hypothetical protein